MSGPSDWNEKDEDTEEEAECARRAFNPDGMIDVILPSGAVARVSPDVSLETLAALDRMARAAMAQMGRAG